MGIPISIFHSHTIKPFDEKQFVRLTKKFNNKDFKKIHPAGSLGAQLKTVEDIMLTGNKCDLQHLRSVTTQDAEIYAAKEGTFSNVSISIHTVILYRLTIFGNISSQFCKHRRSFSKSSECYS